MGKCEASCIDFCDEDIKEIFPKRLKNVRQKAGLTQAQLADALGISVSALSYYECGARIPDIIFLHRVQTYFNIPDGYLLGNTDTLNNSYVDISNKLNLSDEAITKLIDFVAEGDLFSNEIDNNPLLEVLNDLLESDEFYSAIKLIVWSEADRNFRYPDNDYINFVVTTKFNNLVKSIRDNRLNEPDIKPISEDQAIQQDYFNYIIEKMQSREGEKELKEKYKKATELRILNMKELQTEYKKTERYKAICNLKEASDNGNHNPKNE